MSSDKQTKTTVRPLERWVAPPGGGYTGAPKNGKPVSRPTTPPRNPGGISRATAPTPAASRARG